MNVSGSLFTCLSAVLYPPRTPGLDISPCTGPARGARVCRNFVSRTPCPYAVPRVPLAACSRLGDAHKARYVVRARADAPAPRVPSLHSVTPAARAAVRWPKTNRDPAPLGAEPFRRTVAAQGRAAGVVVARCEGSAFYFPFPRSTWMHERKPSAPARTIGLFASKTRVSDFYSLKNSGRNSVRNVPINDRVCPVRGSMSASLCSRSSWGSHASSKAGFDPRGKFGASRTVAQSWAAIPDGGPGFPFSRASRAISPRLAHSFSCDPRSPQFTSDLQAATPSGFSVVPRHQGDARDRFPVWNSSLRDSAEVFYFITPFVYGNQQKEQGQSRREARAGRNNRPRESLPTRRRFGEPLRPHAQRAGQPGHVLQRELLAFVQGRGR